MESHFGNAPALVQWYGRQAMNHRAGQTTDEIWSATMDLCRKEGAVWTRHFLLPELRSLKESLRMHTRLVPHSGAPSMTDQELKDARRQLEKHLAASKTYWNESDPEHEEDDDESFAHALSAEIAAAESERWALDLLEARDVVTVQLRAAETYLQNYVREIVRGESGGPESAMLPVGIDSKERLAVLVYFCMRELGYPDGQISRRASLVRAIEKLLPPKPSSFETPFDFQIEDRRFWLKNTTTAEEAVRRAQEQMAIKQGAHPASKERFPLNSGAKSLKAFFEVLQEYYDDSRRFFAEDFCSKGN